MSEIFLQQKNRTDFSEPIGLSGHARSIAEAKKYKEKGDFENAAHAYESAEKFYEAGECYEQVEMFDKAKKCYQRSTYLLEKSAFKKTEKAKDIQDTRTRGNLLDRALEKIKKSLQSHENYLRLKQLESDYKENDLNTLPFKREESTKAFIESLR